MTEGQLRKAKAREARREWERAQSQQRAETARKRALREATESQSQLETEGGRGSAKPGGADTSIGPHPQVQVNQLVNQYASRVLPGELAAVVAGNALNPRAILVLVEGKVVGARKRPADSFAKGFIVGLVRDGNEWVVQGRYNRWGIRVFTEHEQREIKRRGNGGADQEVEVGASGQREPGLRDTGEADVGGAVAGGAGGEGDGDEGAGGDAGEAAVGGTGARAGYGVGEDEGGEVKL